MGKAGANGKHRKRKARPTVNASASPHFGQHGTKDLYTAQQGARAGRPYGACIETKEWRRPRLSLSLSRSRPSGVTAPGIPSCADRAGRRRDVETAAS